jgi:ergothioneine biosynthesis protein EgtB
MLTETYDTRANVRASRNAVEDPVEDLAGRYRAARRCTELLAEPLAVEDCVVQTMEDVSPTKWHLAHTSWFFEAFVLQRFCSNYAPFHAEYSYLFNSYYVQAGERHCRDRRGYISRPTVRDVMDYRDHVDERMQAFLTSAGTEALSEAAPIVEIGMHHEQQHQELILTDIKHVFAVNPLRPAYRARSSVRSEPAGPLEWMAFEAGVYEIGHGGAGFAYDNEKPRHKYYLHPFLLGSRPVTNSEYMAFMDDGGYERPELWLSMGWAEVEERAWSEPFYWEPRDGTWWTYTLGGMKEVDPNEPVVHVNYFEADAFARWAGARLPTEEEWEIAAGELPVDGHFAEEGDFHPRPSGSGKTGLVQLYGDVWEWTQSQYSPYPGYAAPEGALGEYNGKFMCNQFVLRGGSCATSRTHIRRTYRNFFPPEAAWQFTGFRLARDPDSSDVHPLRTNPRAGTRG